ncbi:MAG: FCD domain-containing protein [Rhodoferax sp.]|nr:FCD domain-containing protein [Rhodoferax sp.]
MSNPSSAPTYSDYVFDHLRADIVSGALAPRAKLAMKDLSTRYKVGLSPIREALHRLVGEGFVQFVGQRGFTVPPLSLEDLEDLTALRSLVEEAAVRQAIARGDDAWEARIVAAFHRLDLQVSREMPSFSGADDVAIARYDAVHRSFHMAMYAGVVSPRLTALHANLFDQAFRYRKTLHNQPLSGEEVLREHRHLMELVLGRQADAAVEALCAHLQLTKQSAQLFMAEQAARNA